METDVGGGKLISSQTSTEGVCTALKQRECCCKCIYIYILLWYSSNCSCVALRMDHTASHPYGSLPGTEGLPLRAGTPVWSRRVILQKVKLTFRCAILCRSGRTLLKYIHNQWPGGKSELCHSSAGTAKWVELYLFSPIRPYIILLKANVSPPECH
jgi:hypothetical protein